MRRQSRLWKDLAGRDTGPLEDQQQAPPPSPSLMDHLWEKFGDRTGLGDADMLHGLSGSEAILVALGADKGREEVLNYLDEMLSKGAPTK